MLDTALGSLLLNSAPKVLGFFSDRNEVSRRNREKLKQHELNKAKYINDFNRDIVKWQNDSADRDIQVDDVWQQTLSKLASDDLKLWSGMQKAGIATQQAYAAMMSVGASEQSGRRSATTINRREAVLKYAGKMNEIASQVALAKNTAALNRTTWSQEFNRQAQASEIKTITGRPMPGTPPPSIPLENQPDLLTGLVLPLAGEFLKYRQLKSELDPPYTDEEMRGDDSSTEQSTSITPSTFNAWSLPNTQKQGQTTNQQSISSFFSKRGRNLASSQLGSSFLTQAIKT